MHLSYEAIFSESTLTIDMVYRDMRGSRAQVAGIEDWAGTHGLAACPSGTTCAFNAGDAVRFVPSP